MATAFEPSLSTSAMRPPLSSVHAPSMADSLPSINFGFDELRDRMVKFTVKFDNFIEAGRKRVEDTFAWSAIADQTIALYKQLIASHPA